MQQTILSHFDHTSTGYVVIVPLLDGIKGELYAYITNRNFPKFSPFHSENFFYSRRYANHKERLQNNLEENIFGFQEQINFM